MIARGTTPYHNFILPQKAERIIQLYVTYIQNDEVVLEKALGDSGVTIENIEDLYENGQIEGELSEEELNCSQLTLHLTQEETLEFKFYKQAKRNLCLIQVKFLDSDNEVFESDFERERIMGTSNERILVNE